MNSLQCFRYWWDVEERNQMRETETRNGMTWERPALTGNEQVSWLSADKAAWAIDSWFWWHLEILSFPLDEQKCALPWHFHPLRMFLKIESGDSFVWEARMSGTVSESLKRTHQRMLKNPSRQQGPQGHLGRQSCWHLLCSREHGTGHKRNVLWSFKYELVGTRESGCFQGPSRERWTELVANQKKKITSCALRSHGYILLWRLKAGNLDWTASSRGKELQLLLINLQF